MKYVTPEEILVIHAVIIEETGGLHGVRDAGLLISAAKRPRAMLGKRELYRGALTKTAVYIDSLAKHHVFIDGNKRTALAVAARLLFLHGLEYRATNKELERFVVRVVTERLDVKTIAYWLQRHTRKARH